MSQNETKYTVNSVSARKITLAEERANAARMALQQANAEAVEASRLLQAELRAVTGEDEAEIRNYRIEVTNDRVHLFVTHASPES